MIAPQEPLKIWRLRANGVDSVSMRWRLGVNARAAAPTLTEPKSISSRTLSNALVPACKFPCKHGLALFLLLAKERDAFTSTEAPEWVLTSFLQRHAREGKQKRSDQDDERATPPAPVAQAKRASKRQANVKAGLEDFDRWLQDLVRRGLASTQNESYVFWENQAKHLVDAQAPGIARLVRECAGTPASGNGWQERLMHKSHRFIYCWKRTRV